MGEGGTGEGRGGGCDGGGGWERVGRGGRWDEAGKGDFFALAIFQL